jgi:hypothetical protein
MLDSSNVSVQDPNGFLPAPLRDEVSFTKGRIIVRGKLVTRGKAKHGPMVWRSQSGDTSIPTSQACFLSTN